MIEQQFIRFMPLDEIDNSPAIPFTDDGMRFYLDVETLGYEYVSKLEERGLKLTASLVYPNSKFIANCNVYFDMSGEKEIFAIFDSVTVKNNIAPNDLFRIIISEELNGSGGGAICKSNLLQYMPDSQELSLLSYYCNEPEFGIPFYSFIYKNIPIKGLIEQPLPIKLSSPQFKQEDKIYNKLNGEQVVLYSTIQKEYSGETDYIPEEWHEKIVIALACDEVYIKGERVTKSDSYEINNDNYTYSDSGIKLTRATFKVKTNIIQRNSNY